MDDKTVQTNNPFKTPFKGEVFTNDVQEKDGFYLTVNMPSTVPQTATNYPIFFIARFPCEVLRVSEVHGVAGSDAGSVTLDVEKLSGTTAKGSGVSILASTFDLKSTANVVIYKEAFLLSSQRQLREGDRLALESGGTLTDLADVQVTLYLKFLGRGDYK